LERDLLPPDMELDCDLVDLMRLVFRASCVERKSARHLLDHPLIINGKQELQSTAFWIGRRDHSVLIT